MAATTMNKVDPWLMDDRIPYDPAALVDVHISPELQAKVDAIFDDDDASQPAVQPAA